MVEYKVSRYLLSKVVVIPVDGDGDPTFDRTVRNLNKMISDGRKCKVISPVKVLDKSETEEYRKYFCKKAKEHGVNYIYFTVPIKLYKESN